MNLATLNNVENQGYHRSIVDPHPGATDSGHWVYIRDNNELLAESFYFCFYHNEWNCHTRGMIIRNVSEQDPFCDDSVWMMIYAK